MKHRRLTWFYALGTATLRGNFASKPIDMTMLPTQAAVCLLFNSSAALRASLSPSFWPVFSPIWA